MNINMLFFTIIIKTKKISREEADHQDTIRHSFDHAADRKFEIRTIM
ncbi:YrzI family small protein [Peribacillus kribbensis]|nr:YrzI family small protein [Peribacillus kribbensis]